MNLSTSLNNFRLESISSLILMYEEKEVKLFIYPFIIDYHFSKENNSGLTLIFRINDLIEFDCKLSC